MLFGALMTAVFSLAFGFCKSLAAAVAVRFLGGALGGTTPVCKTYIGETTTEENQAKAFGVIAFLYGFGAVVAPAFGGFLSYPARTMPSVFGDTLFERCVAGGPRPTPRAPPAAGRDADLTIPTARRAGDPPGTPSASRCC